MAFCRKCGMEIDDEAVVCVHCGVPTDKYHKAMGNGEDNPSTVLAVLSFFVPMIGIIIGLCCFSVGKKKSGEKYISAAIMAVVALLMLAIIGASVSAPQ